MTGAFLIFAMLNIFIIGKVPHFEFHEAYLAFNAVGIGLTLLALIGQPNNIFSTSQQNRYEGEYHPQAGKISQGIYSQNGDDRRTVAREYPLLCFYGQQYYPICELYHPMDVYGI